MIDPKTGKVFWTEGCEDPIKAINFALDVLTSYDRGAFLSDWREGDVSDWPKFIEFVTKQEK